MLRKILSASLIGLSILGISVSSYAYSYGWKQDAYGWWFEENGGYIRNAWKQDIKGHWYHFNQDGYMDVGWIQVGGYWYYLGGDGSMRTGWISYGGKDYYLSSPDGHMLKDTVTPDGYRVGSDGAWIRQEASANIPEYYKYFQDGNIIPEAGKDWEERNHYAHISLVLSPYDNTLIDQGAYYVVQNWELWGTVFYDYNPGYNYIMASNGRWFKSMENLAPEETYKLYTGNLYIDKNAIVYSVDYSSGDYSVKRTVIGQYYQELEYGKTLLIKSLDEKGFVTEFVAMEWS